jgi:adhesin/invasin
MTAEQDSLFADNSSTTTIDVYAKDGFGNPVFQGTPIGFSAYGGEVTPSATVNEDGYVQIIFQAGLVAGPAAVTAVNGSVQSSISIYLMPTPAGSLSLTAVPTQLTADASSTANLTALVLDAENRPVSDGTVVVFTSILGTLGGEGPAASSPGPGSLTKTRPSWAEENRKPSAIHSSKHGPMHPGQNPTQSVYSTTTQNGYAYAILTCATLAAVDTVTASTGQISDMVLVTYKPGAAAQISIEPEVESIPADGVSSTDIAIQIRDGFGNAVGAGLAVTAQATMGTLFPTEGHTNPQGVLVTNLQSERRTGVAAITAQSGSAVGYGEVEFSAPDIGAIALQAYETSLLADGVSTTVLQTYVVDLNGVPVAQRWVMWSASAGIGAVIPSMSLTDSVGIALAMFQSGASSTDAGQIVRASVGGFSDSIAISMRGITLSLVAEDEYLPADGEATTEIRAHVQETTTHIGLSSVNVMFATTLGSIPQIAPTNGSGVASVALTAGTTIGTANITAFYGDTLTAVTQVNMISTQGDAVILIPASSSLLGDGLSTTQLRAYVTDEQGIAVYGEPVTFAIASGVGTVVPSTAITGQDGYAQVTFISGAVIQDVQTVVEARITQDTTAAILSVRGVTMQCSAAPQMIVADGHSSATIHVHLFETERLIAIAGADIHFGTSLGSIPNWSETNVSGQVAASLASGMIPGTAQVIARYGNELADTTQVVFAQSEPTNLNISASPTSILADNTSTSTITVNVTDQGGNPVPDGTTIHFYIPPNSGSIEYSRTTVGGMAINVLTSVTNPDTVEVLAWVDDNPSVRDSVRVTYTVGTPALVTATAQSDTLKADGISVDTIMATVTDNNGHRLTNVEVQFTASLGNISASRTTGADGIARVPYSSPATGIATITATAGTGEGHCTVYLIPGCPWSIEMEYEPNSVGVRESGRNETLLITATVKDASNNRVLDGTPVYFDIYSQPIAHPDSMGGLSSTDSVPTINGRASVSYTSGYRSGTVRIRARSYGICEEESYSISAITTEILIFAGPPYIEDIANPLGCGYFNTSHMKVAASPCDLVGWSAVGDSVHIVAIVGDKWNNPVTEGTAVYFTTSGGVISTATGFTDANGFATVTLYGGNPMPTLDRWWNTLQDPNLGGSFNCWGDLARNGIAKVLATSEGQTVNNQSAIVWASCDVRFTAPYDHLVVVGSTINGDPDERTLYIGENALITFELWEGGNHWPIDSESQLSLSASAGRVYPYAFDIGCPGDTIFTVSFFNNLTTEDQITATPVLIEVDSKNGNAWAFTETFTLLPQRPPGAPPVSQGGSRTQRQERRVP